MFFGKIALLVPSYMKERPEEINAPIVVGLREHGFLEIIEAKTALDKCATEKLVTSMTDVITSGKHRFQGPCPSSHLLMASALIAPFGVYVLQSSESIGLTKNPR